IERAIDETDLVFVDEIGKLELWRGEGIAPVLPLLETGEIERAVVIVRAELLPELQARLAGVETSVFEVTEANRDQAPAGVLAMLAGNK
ncbi:MAG: hypothetical protein JXA93_04210, partial [Anaerolineae bacterium]|nr:hypothetical protein [Anaerolineae bacterium]